MNYRRGLKRVHAVLTILWMVVVFVLAVRDRPQALRYDALVTKFISPDPPKFIELKDRADAGIGEKLQYWGIQSAVALVPPGVLYLFLFSVVPWIYSGFQARDNSVEQVRLSASSPSRMVRSSAPNLAVLPIIPEKRLTVTRVFTCRELARPFIRTLVPSEEVVFLHYIGDRQESAVFAMLSDVLRCTESAPEPSPKYEVRTELFELSTTGTET